MTIYVPKLRELPRNQMPRLVPEAEFILVEAGGMASAYVYRWPDLVVTINVKPDAEIPEHMEGFVGYARSVARASGHALDATLDARIRATTIVLGFVIEGPAEPAAWHDRVQDLISMICYNTKALLFWETAIFDEDCQQLLPSPTGG